MSCKSGDWQREKRTLEVLSSLSYRTGEIKLYLQEITLGVSELLELDWSVVTLCQKGFERVLASSIDLGNSGNEVYSLHGLLTGTVVNTRQSLVVEDTKTCADYGKAPEGYRAYLGVPLRTAQGEVIGTICSFHKTPRHFTAEEVQIAELFAERAATAIDNYYLYQQQLQFNHILEAEVARRTEELRAAQTKLVEQERLAAIGEFAACIIHEIRNPLTTMKMGLNFFQRLDLSESAKERLSLALDEASRLERLLKEILLYAKPQSLQLEKIDINQFISEILPSLQGMPEAIGRQIEFSAAINVVQILGDKDKLKQVLINIVRNACEAIPEGESVKLIIYSDGNNNQVYINIHNSGAPIPPEVLPNLTKPFYSTKSSGTGLGLAITKRIVEAHNGELLIESTATEGTTVRVHLPLTADC
ncbi:MAG: GAF domain-containing protein [Chlorogloeopsis fritschii C42_A2020_084]|uniref:GAF domain-containing sensor histidine kinase n=1 Tax=Chlorogloeopsis fritschii TaxID=1124 RepID=UPI001A097810|nr:GAF domain-containing sensor histidine kinase [Chlorogloeopsis fritschii]MBF2008777.1 GAF domain-containing protein [Chlorogloeopsis fritschii C42_A2020_084]